MDKNVGTGNLRGKMTDVATVEVVIKSSKEPESKERCRHEKKVGEIWRSVLIDIVYVQKLTVEVFSLKVFL